MSDDTSAPRPRLRYAVLDARPPAAPDPRAPRRVTPAEPPSSRDVDVRCVFLTAHNTRDLVTAARGVDCVVVIPGSRIGQLAREARVLRAAGVRAGVIAIGDLGASPRRDELERNARHLLNGIGLSGDDALSAAADDTYLDAVARSTTPQARDGFIVVGRSAAARGFGGRITARVVAGVMPAAASAHVLHADGFSTARVMSRRGAGDDESFLLDIGDHDFRNDDDVVLASEAIPCARRFVVARPAVVRAMSAEPCAAFGGFGGWGTGTVRNGVVEIDRSICPRDGRIGVILFQGAGLGPVHVVDAFPFAPRTPTTSAPDREALFQLMKSALHDQVVATYGPWDEAWQRDRFEKTYATATIAKPNGAFTVYDDERGVFALVDVEVAADDGRAPSLYLARIYVDPRAQGCGVGTALMRDVMARAAKDKLDVTLRVLRSNVRARSLHERLGFRVDGETDTHFHMRAARDTASTRNT